MQEPETEICASMLDSLNECIQVCLFDIVRLDAVIDASFLLFKNYVTKVLPCFWAYGTCQYFEEQTLCCLDGHFEKEGSWGRGPLI